jgi:surfactin synthase thioesterase subunit
LIRCGTFMGDFHKLATTQAKAGDAVILPAIMLMGLAEGGVTKYRVARALERARGMN